ncbi:hypothetical protein K1X76_09205 [bacterium]|nr:hypothetical protein [bacterium]
MGNPFGVPDYNLKFDDRVLECPVDFGTPATSNEAVTPPLAHPPAQGPSPLSLGVLVSLLIFRFI